MKQANKTIYICDCCKETVIKPDYSEYPEGWIWFNQYSSFNYLNISFRRGEKDLDFEIDIRKKHFCSIDCFMVALSQEAHANFNIAIETEDRVEPLPTVPEGGETPVEPLFKE